MQVFAMMRFAYNLISVILYSSVRIIRIGIPRFPCINNILFCYPPVWENGRVFTALDSDGVISIELNPRIFRTFDVSVLFMFIDVFVCVRITHYVLRLIPAPDSGWGG